MHKLYYTLVECKPLTPLLRIFDLSWICCIAKFHYTGPTGPARTRTDPNDPDLRETPLVRAGLRQSPRGSVRVRAGQVGSGWARVVEFSLNWFLHCCAAVGKFLTDISRRAVSSAIVELVV